VENDHVLHCILQVNARLQQLNISTTGRNVLHQAEHMLHLWRYSPPTPLRLTLIECVQDTLGRIVAQVAIGEIDHKSARVEAQEQWPADQAETNLLEWRFQLSDDSACFLNMAVQQHALVLTLLILDTTRLSLFGISCLQKALSQSRLEFFKVECTAFDVKLSSSIAQILYSVHWSTLKSLVLSGDHIEEWLQLWVA